MADFAAEPVVRRELGLAALGFLRDVFLQRVRAGDFVRQGHAREVLAAAARLLCRDPLPAVRARAATLAGAIGGEELVETLMELLDDPDAAVRASAALGAVAKCRSTSPDAVLAIAMFARRPRATMSPDALSSATSPVTPSTAMSPDEVSRSAPSPRP